MRSPDSSRWLLSARTGRCTAGTSAGTLKRTHDRAVQAIVCTEKYDSGTVGTVIPENTPAHIHIIIIFLPLLILYLYI